MKLAFTTLGCPRWDVAAIVARAVEYGFDGVDFRGYLGEINIYKLAEFTTQAKETARKFADAGLKVTCTSSSARLMAGAESLDEVRAYARMCEAFGAPYLRVFGGGIGTAPREQAVEAAAKNCRAMAEVAKDHGVMLLVETHDEWLDSSLMRSLMDAVGSPAAAVLWDVHHPYRLIGEAPATTWKNLGPWIRNTHWKDSAQAKDAPGGHRLCLMGEGDIPLYRIFETLKKGGYDGWLTLEWEKHWHPELAEPEVAYPQYVQFIRKLMRRPQRRKG